MDIKNELTKEIPAIKIESEKAFVFAELEQKVTLAGSEPAQISGCYVGKALPCYQCE